MAKKDVTPKTDSGDPPHIGDYNAAARYIGIAPGTLRNWVMTGKEKVPWIPVGRRVRFLFADLDKWLAARRINTPPEAA